MEENHPPAFSLEVRRSELRCLAALEPDLERLRNLGQDILAREIEAAAGSKERARILERELEKSPYLPWIGTLKRLLDEIGVCADLCSCNSEQWYDAVDEADRFLGSFPDDVWANLTGDDIEGPLDLGLFSGDAEKTDALESFHVQWDEEKLEVVTGFMGGTYRTVLTLLDAEEVEAAEMLQADDPWETQIGRKVKGIKRPLLLAANAVTRGYPNIPGQIEYGEIIQELERIRYLTLTDNEQEVFCRLVGEWHGSLEELARASSDLLT